MSNIYSTSINVRLKQGSWRDSFPPFGPRMGKGELIKKTEESWSDVWQKINDFNQVAISVGGVFDKDNRSTPVSLDKIHAFLDKLENWVAEYGHVLTWPSSSKAWKEAVRNTIDNGDLDSVILLAATFPEQFKETIQNIKEPNNKVGKWLNSFKEETKPELVSSVEHKNEINEKNSNSIAEEKKILQETLKPAEVTDIKIEKKPFLNTLAKETMDWLMNIVKEFENDEHVLAVKKEKFDGKLKNWMRRNDSTDANQRLDFFAEQFFPAITHMDRKDLLVIYECWPNGKKIEIDSPDEVLTSKIFWALLKHAKDDTKEFIIDNMLPKTISLAQNRFEQKFKIGKDILSWATRNPELFNQRLNLWMNIGGSLTENAVLVSNTDGNEDLFTDPGKKIEKESLMSWILKSGNDMWVEELAKISADKGMVIPEIQEAYNAIVDAKSKNKSSPGM